MYEWGLYFLKIGHWKLIIPSIPYRLPKIIVGLPRFFFENSGGGICFLLVYDTKPSLAASHCRSIFCPKIQKRKPCIKRRYPSDENNQSDKSRGAERDALPHMLGMFMKFLDVMQHNKFKTQKSKVKSQKSKL